MRAHFENWKKSIDFLYDCLQKVEGSIIDFKQRIEIEEAKPEIEKYLIISKSWLKDEIKRKEKLISYLEERIIRSNKLLDDLKKYYDKNEG